MTIAAMNWMQVEAYLKTDDRAVVPLGSTEQHAYLSLCVDNILAEKVATDAAAPLGVPVFPVLNYGLTPYFMAYPGTVSLRVETYVQIMHDILASLKRAGFKRILFVNGHGGNNPASAYMTEWMLENPDVSVKFHNWWNAPKTLAKVKEIDPVASHASWMENFPWTRLAGVVMPDETKRMIHHDAMNGMNADNVREFLQDGNFGGAYQKDDATMLALWDVGVKEVRAALESNW